DETGEISAKQANLMIAEAKKSRDQTIAYVEEMHKDIVSEAKAQANEHVNQVNWETGEIKSKWQVMKQDVSSKMKDIGSNIKKDWSQAYSDANKWVGDMANSVDSKFHAMGKNIGIKMNEAKDFVVNKWKEAEGFLRGIDLRQIGIDIIQGLVNGIGSMTRAVTDKVK